MLTPKAGAFRPGLFSHAESGKKYWSPEPERDCLSNLGRDHVAAAVSGGGWGAQHRGEQPGIRRVDRSVGDRGPPPDQVGDEWRKIGFRPGDHRSPGFTRRQEATLRAVVRRTL